MARAIRSDQEYKDKLLKLIPSEIVAAYTFVRGVAGGGIELGGKEVSFVVLCCAAGLLLVLTPLYLIKVQKVKFVPQIVFTVVSVPVWVYSLGPPGPFRDVWHSSTLGAIVLVLWTLVIPFAIKPGDDA